jgi:acylphosphatase
LKANLETLEDGTVRLTVEGSAHEVLKIQSSIMSMVTSFMTSASKVEEKE